MYPNNMRSKFLLIAGFAATAASAQTVTSIMSGSAQLPTTWSCLCVPGPSNNVVVGHTVIGVGTTTYAGLRILGSGYFTKTNTGALDVTGILDIDAGGTLQNNGQLEVHGDYINDGTHAGTGIVKLTGSNTTISGTGTITNNAQLAIQSGNKTILAGTQLNKTANNVRLFGSSVTNNGSFELLALNGDGWWTQGANSTLKVHTAVRNAVHLEASAVGNTVSYLRTDSSTQVIKDPEDGAYHHLVLASTSIAQKRKPEAALVVNGDLSFTNCTFDVHKDATDHPVTVRGAWYNAGMLSPHSGTITIGGNAISHIVQPVAQSFNDLVIAGTDTVKIDQAITVTGSMTINGILDVQEPGNAAIDVDGDWTCNGMLVARYGQVVLSGANAQAMTGETFFHDLEINNSSATGVNIASGPQHLRGALTLSDGNLAANGMLHIASNPTYGDARVAPITGGSVSGNVRVFRYIDAGATNWRFLTSPSGGMTLQDWQDDFITSGYPGSAFPSFPFTSIYGYSEAAPGTEDDGFVAASSSAQTIAQGAGYWVWCGDSLGGTAPFTIDVNGPLYTGDRFLPVAYTNNGNPSGDGWTMVGNPYASAIDWDAPSWVKTNINNAIYIWDPDAENFAGYVGGVSINGGSNFIASSQAFWVQANAPGPVLRASENVKTAMAVGFKSASNMDILRLRLVGNGLSDETVLRTISGATSGFDGAFDAYEKFSATVAAPSISSKLPGNKNMMVNTVAPFTADTTFQVKVKVGAQASYAIQFSEVEGAFAASCMVLEDVVLGVSTPIIEGGSYSFSMSPNYNGTRFRVHATAPVQVEATPVSCHDASDGSAVVTGTGIGPWTYNWTDDNGNTLQTSTVNGPDDLENLAAGTYIVTVSGTCPQLLVEVEITAPEALSASAALTGNTCNATVDGAIDLTVQGGTAPYTYLWSNGSTAEDQPALAAGTYSVAIADANDCFTTQSFAITPTTIVEAAFTMPASADMGVPVQFADGSSGATSYAWDFGDGSPIDIGSDPVHVFDVPGVYTVSLTVANGTCESMVTGAIEIIGLSTGVGTNSDGGISIVQQNDQVVLMTSIARSLGVSVRDLLGQEVVAGRTGCFNAGANVIDLPETATGVLLIQVSDMSGPDNVTFKLVR